MAEKYDCEEDDGRNCGEYQKDNRLLRNTIVKEMMEGIVVNIRKIIGG